MNRAGIEAPPDYRPPRPWPLVALVLAALAVALGGAVQVWRDLRELERVRSSAAGPPVLGSLARVEGEASIRGARDLAWRVAGEGDRVHGLDRVRTGAGSGCLILPLDFPPIRVGERSLVELAGGAWGRALGGELRVDLGALEARLG
ncbi:MAG: hypothetical protein HY722_14835, partial [Planctomycetes bacterium]|nr:hypothetical protein [Planctomycetota bacterium]